MTRPSRLSRRGFLKMGATGAVAGGVALLPTPSMSKVPLIQSVGDTDRFGHDLVHPASATQSDSSHGGSHASGYDFDPGRFLTDFYWGTKTVLQDGRILREYEISSIDREIEVAPGVVFPAWTFNGHVPGPTIRAEEGDLIRIRFTNRGSHDHTMHFHGFHPAGMDGAFEPVKPGDSFVYEFTAEPFGLHLYHCHVMPLRKHIAKGLYGTFIVDPRTPREPMDEMVMVMNGFDTDFDEENEFYTVNGISNYYMDHPIRVKVGSPFRIYLVNITESDPVNSFHQHANFFRAYRTGTRLDLWEYTDTIMLCQGERAILEMTPFRRPGRYMFHAHQSEFAEKGWVGVFEAVE